jgi:hypothetical protein
MNGSGTLIYRRGGTNPSNLRPRAVDQGRLSFWTSLDPPVRADEPPRFPPGSDYFVVDTRWLPPGSVVHDAEPPGHVSVIDVPAEVVRDAIVERGRIPR